MPPRAQRKTVDIFSDVTDISDLTISHGRDSRVTDGYDRHGNGHSTRRERGPPIDFTWQRSDQSSKARDANDEPFNASRSRSRIGAYETMSRAPSGNNLFEEQKKSYSSIPNVISDTRRPTQLPAQTPLPRSSAKISLRNILGEAAADKSEIKFPTEEVPFKPADIVPEYKARSILTPSEEAFVRKPSPDHKVSTRKLCIPEFTTIKDSSSYKQEKKDKLQEPSYNLPKQQGYSVLVDDTREEDESPKQDIGGLRSTNEKPVPSRFDVLLAPTTRPSVTPKVDLEKTSDRYDSLLDSSEQVDKWELNRQRLLREHEEEKLAQSRIVDAIEAKKNRIEADKQRQREELAEKKRLLDEAHRIALAEVEKQRLLEAAERDEQAAIKRIYTGKLLVGSSNDVYVVSKSIEEFYNGQLSIAEVETMWASCPMGSELYGSTIVLAVAFAQFYRSIMSVAAEITEAQEISTFIESMIIPAADQAAEKCKSIVDFFKTRFTRPEFWDLVLLQEIARVTPGTGLNRLSHTFNIPTLGYKALIAAHVMTTEQFQFWVKRQDDTSENRSVTLALIKTLWDFDSIASEQMYDDGSDINDDDDE